MHEFTNTDVLCSCLVYVFKFPSLINICNGSHLYLEGTRGKEKKPCLLSAQKIAQDFASLPPSLTLFLFLSSSSHSSLELQFITLSRPLLVNFLRANNLFRQNRREGFINTRKIPFNFLDSGFVKTSNAYTNSYIFLYALVSFSMVFVVSLLVCM